MSIVEKNKRKTLTIKMLYNSELYERVEEAEFNYDLNEWLIKSISWKKPTGDLVAVYMFLVIKSPHSNESTKMNDKLLFKTLEREYKLNGLEI